MFRKLIVERKKVNFAPKLGPNKSKYLLSILVYQTTSVIYDYANYFTQMNSSQIQVHNKSVQLIRDT